MKKVVTIEFLSEKLEGKLWVKENLKRIYLNEGYNTKKMETKTFVYQSESGDFVVSCKIYCPSQTFAWIASQEKEVKERVANQIAEIIVEFGEEKEPTTSTPIDVVLNNATLAAIEVEGYYTEWRVARVPINRFGKLVTRNRQFAVAFKGNQSNAPKTFVPMLPEHYLFLVNNLKGEQMLEPYVNILDLTAQYNYYAKAALQN